jgi:glutaconate CoA-transferase subunit A
MQDKRMNLREAVNRYVTDGCSIAFGGVVSREPYAACMEIIRQKKKEPDFYQRFSIRCG